MQDLGERIAKLESQQATSHEDMKELISEVKALRTDLTKGKGVALGIFMVLGAAYTVISHIIK